jgi:hypothetical protein
MVVLLWQKFLFVLLNKDISFIKGLKDNLLTSDAIVRNTVLTAALFLLTACQKRLFPSKYSCYANRRFFSPVSEAKQSRLVNSEES